MLDRADPAQTSVAPLPLEAASGQRMTYYRWVILGLIFLGTTVNFVDRIVIAILAPDLQLKYGISDIQYGYIGSAFGLAYALGQLISGGLLDRFGTRLVYAIALVTWSISAMLTSLARGPLSFGIFRAMLGFFESPAYPGAARTCAEWFPRHQRAFAFGFVNAGCNMAAILTPLVVPWLAVNYGWQAAFIITGAMGFIVLLLWIPLYRTPETHPSVSPAELALIHSDPPEPTAKVRWVTLLSHRQAWAFALGKFVTDPMWWFFMTWFPKFLHDRHQLDLLHIGVPLIVIYVLADVGSLAGGWLSSAMIRAGFSVNHARKTAMVICASLALPIMFAQNISSLWTAILVLGMATAAHQGFSSNLYTLCSDMFPKRAVASVAGLGGSCGWIGASIFQAFTGNWVQRTGNYYGPFLCAALAYIIAVATIHLLVPKLSPAKIDPAVS